MQVSWSFEDRTKFEDQSFITKDRFHDSSSVQDRDLAILISFPPWIAGAQHALCLRTARAVHDMCTLGYVVTV